MGVGLGGRGKRRRNIGQNHGGAKDCGGVKEVISAFVSTGAARQAQAKAAVEKS